MRYLVPYILVVVLVLHLLSFNFLFVSVAFPFLQMSWNIPALIDRYMFYLSITSISLDNNSLFSAFLTTLRFSIRFMYPYTATRSFLLCSLCFGRLRSSRLIFPLWFVPLGSPCSSFFSLFSYLLPFRCARARWWSWVGFYPSSNSLMIRSFQLLAALSISSCIILQSLSVSLLVFWFAPSFSFWVFQLVCLGDLCSYRVVSSLHVFFFLHSCTPSDASNSIILSSISVLLRSAYPHLSFFSLFGFRLFWLWSCSSCITLTPYAC